MKKELSREMLIDIGRDMQYMVTRAIEIIQKESHSPLVMEKQAYDVTTDDCVTSGDRLAQEMYIWEIKCRFPKFGIIAEEKELTIPCTHPDHDIYFTVDPVDGTKAYARKQSHGVGTMLALVCDGKIVAAYIGDANTGEIYGYTDADERGQVFRNRFGVRSNLKPDVIRPLNKQYIFLREAPQKNPPIIHKMARPDQDGLFKDMEVGGGSIGTLMARLWKGEIGAVVRAPHFETPWDLMPILGISQRLGFCFIKFEQSSDPYKISFTQHVPRIITKVTEIKYFELIVHRKHLPAVKAWLKEKQKEYDKK